MASLEYLTQNSLIAYPFKGRVAVDSNNLNPIQDNWFLDILFVSYTDTIRGVYISNLEKNAEGELFVTFNNSETLQPLQSTSIAISAADLEDHLQNPTKSFASYNSELFAVKFVFGAGIVEKEAFNQNYTIQEAELTSAAIILRTPDVDNLTFESYENISPGNPTGFIKNYTPEDSTPVVKPSHNTAFKLTGVNAGRLDVLRGAGEGLYNNCPDLKENVYTVNRVDPDPYGALFLKTSDCYTSNVLSNNDIILYGQYLDPYKNFVTHTSNNPADDVLFDAVSPQHSIVLENFCKPKCPPENMSAFAYYLNRVTDGALELDKIAARKEETHGEGTPLLNVFTASSFCVENNPFIRCVDPDTGLSNIECGDKFVKYYHEGRTLQLYYDNLTIREYIVIEVLSDYSVKLDTAPTLPSGDNSSLFFRLIDNGVISNVNCAVDVHNQEAATFLTPYFKVKYTTTESFNSDGIYVTYLAVSIAIFNPSRESVTVQAVFSPTVLTRQGSYKIRTPDNVSITLDPVATVPCREYAFIEAIFYIACEQTGGSLDIELLDISQEEQLRIGDIFNIPNVNGAPCLNTVGGEAKAVRVTQTAFNTFTFIFSLSSNTTSISTPVGDVPSWLNIEYSPTQKQVLLSRKLGTVAPTASSVHVFSITSYASDQNTVTFVTIDYVADPIIVSPLGSKYTSTNPIVIAKNLPYTLEEPIFKIFAKNMIRLTALFPDDEEKFSYTLIGNLPAGLVFDETQGILYGEVPEEIPDGGMFNFAIAALNPSGISTVTQDIYLAVNVANLPSISFVDPPENNIFTINNAITYTAADPIYSLISSNNPTVYLLDGVLPAGLYFNASTGKITGRVVSQTPQSTFLKVYAQNFSGYSDKLPFTINYVVYASPVIVFPENDTDVTTPTSTETTLENPLLTIQALQLFGGLDNFDPLLNDITRNSYTAINLPTGIFIDQYTGKIYGRVSTSLFPPNYDLLDFTLSYNAIIYVRNPVGQDFVRVTLNFKRFGIPKITNVSVNAKKTIDRFTEYTSNEPFFKILATNNPTSFSASGLPEGLICTDTGEITGKINETLPAGEYQVLLTATNNIGTSPTAIFKIVATLSIITPSDADTISVNSTITYTTNEPLLEITTTGVNNSSNITYSATSLPTGVSLSDNKLIGNSLAFGSVVAKIIATSSFGSDTVYVTLTTIPTYALSGVFTGVTLPVGLKIKVTDRLGISTYTDIQNNQFSFSSLSNDVYYLQPNPQEHPSHDPTYTFLPASKSVILTSNKTGQNFVASRYYTVAGKIIFPKDNSTHIDIPIEGVSLDLGIGTPVLSANDGTYLINKVPIGSFSVIPYKEGYTFSPSSRQITLVSSNYTLTGVDFNLQTTQTISGRVQSLAGLKSISNVTITLTLVSPAGEVRNLSTDYNGNYSVAVAPGETYIVTPSAQGMEFSPTHSEVVLSIGQNEINVNFLASPSNSIVPTPPLITNITISYRQFIVHFNPAEVTPPGAPIWFYAYSLDNGHTWNEYTGVINQNTLTITGLQDNTSYDVVIRAVNLYSNGGLSNTYTATTPRVPNAPNFYIIPRGFSTNELQIQWEVPENGGSPVLGYKYSLNNNEPVSFAWPHGPFTARTKNIDNLTLGETYTLKLLAYNLVGDSDWAEEKSVQICNRPSEPTITSITTGDNSVAIYFTSNDTGGGTLRKTNVVIASEGTGNTQNFVIDDVTSPIELSGTEYNLLNGYASSIKIQQANDFSLGYLITNPSQLFNFGYSLYSNTVTATPARVPDAPIIVSSPRSSLKLIIRYAIGDAAPYNGGSPITDYLYSLNGGEYISVGSIAYPIVITQNILNGVEYTVRIKAVNAKGASQASQPVVQTPNPSAPEAPIIQSIAGANGQLILNVGEMPADGGAQITGYLYNVIDDLPENYVEGNITLYTENQIVYAQELRPLTISGLTNGQLYTVRLKLKNTIGTGQSAVIQGKPIGIPSAPTITNVVPGDQKLTVTFTAPTYDGGAPIVNYSYSVYYLTDNSGNPIEQLAYNQNIGADVISFDVTYAISNYITHGIVIHASNGTYSSSSIRYGEVLSEHRNTTSFGVPFAPEIEVAIGNNKLTVNASYKNYYGVTGANGRRITALKYSLNDADPVTVIVPNPDNAWRAVDLDFNFSIVGLINDQEYVLKVAAVNEAGVGGYSETTAKPAAPPSPPTILNVQARYNYIRVYHTPQSTVGKPPILGYVATRYSQLEGCTTESPKVQPVTGYNYKNSPLIFSDSAGGSCDGPAPYIYYDGLEPYTNEGLAAINIIGEGSAASLGSFSPQLTTPDEIIIDSVTPDNASVHFSVRSFSDGGCDQIFGITNIYFSIDGGGVFNPVSNLVVTYHDHLSYIITGDIPPLSDIRLGYSQNYTRRYTATFTVEGLENIHAYDFVFRAVSSQGEGEKSVSVTATPAAQPPRASGMDYSNFSTTETTLSFLATELDNRGSPVISFKYKINDDTTEYTIESVSENTEHFVTIGGLTPGTFITMHIAAVNSAGVGEFASLSPIKIVGQPSVQLLEVINQPSFGVFRFATISSGDGTVTVERWQASGVPDIVWEDLPSYDTGGNRALLDLNTNQWTIYIGSSDGLESQVYLRAANSGNYFSEPILVNFNPRSLPTLREFPSLEYSNLNGSYNGEIYVTAVLYSTGGRPVSYKAAIIAEGDPRYDSPGDVTSLLQDISVNYGGELWSITEFKFIINSIGKNYKIFLYAVNEVGLSNQAYGIFASNGSISEAPVITSVTPGNQRGTINVSYTSSANAIGYNDSAISTYEFLVFPGSPDAWYSDGSYFDYSVNRRAYPFSSSNITANGTVTINVVNDMNQEQIVSVRSINTFGSSPVSQEVAGTPSRDPGAPDIVEAVAVKNLVGSTVNHYLYLKLNATDTGGLPVNGYTFSLTDINSTTVYYTENYFLPEGATLNGQTRQVYQIPNLTTSGTIVVKVQLFNDITYLGVVGETYVSFTPTTPSGVSLPDAAVFSVTDGDRSYTLTYQANTVNGGANITSYQYTQNGNATNPSWTTLTVLPGVPFTRTGLTNGTTYAVAVRAVNSATASLTSATNRNWNVISVQPAVTPLAPTLGTISGKDRAVNIAFSLGNNGGAPITNHQYSTDGGATYATLDPADGLSPITISKTSTGSFISNSETYIISLKSVNRKGAGPASVSKSYTVPNGKSNPPTLSTSNTKTSISITYGSPDNNGGAEITAYDYAVLKTSTWQGPDAEATPWIRTGATPQTLNLTSDTTGTPIETGFSYTVAVRAVNSFGPGFATSATAITALVPQAGNIEAVPYRYYNSIRGYCRFPLNNISYSGAPITGFEMSIDDGVTWTPGVPDPLFASSSTYQTFTIYVDPMVYTSGHYKVRCRFINIAGPGAPSNMRSV
jgi:hypothetical protein